MSEFNKFNVAFPKSEDATTLVFNDNFPIEFLFVGMTYPLSSYKILRKDAIDQYLFEYVLDGKGEIIIGGKKIPLNKGDIFFLEKNSKHEYRSNKDNPLKKIWISFKSSYIEKMIEAYKLQSGVYHVNAGKNFSAIFKVSQAQTPPQNKFFSIADNLHQIITKLSENIVLVDTDTISTIKNELLSSIYSKCSLTDIASKLFMSRSNLIRIFKKKEGITPYAFLIRERLSVAQTLLSSTDMTIKAISDLLCFTDEHYFCFIFKQKFGITPTEFRTK